MKKNIKQVVLLEDHFYSINLAYKQGYQNKPLNAPATVHCIEIKRTLGKDEVKRGECGDS